jgi:hypothetical protein
LISSVIRSGHRLVLDIKSYKDKIYIQQYNTEKKDSLI